MWRLRVTAAESRRRDSALSAQVSKSWWGPLALQGLRKQALDAVLGPQRALVPASSMFHALRRGGRTEL